MKQTVRDRVGQSLMLSFDGVEATDEVLDALTLTRACGVILFARNVGAPGELHTLTSSLQAHAAAIGLPPLLIAIDQEGGNVTRLPRPWTTVPSQMAQAATRDLQAATTCARITGQQLRAVGINTNFAPVLDVNNNPANPVIGTRSFGQDPAFVAEWGLAAMRGYREANVIATAKHFPGHGDTHVDSHVGLPVVLHNRERLRSIELLPFQAAFNAHVPAIMTAHIIFEALDPLPATLARSILIDLLRDGMGYTGVVFTDALEMRAIADTYGPIEAALMSKAAGADVLLPLGRLRDQIAIAQALAAAVDDERLSIDMFDATAERLHGLRGEYNIEGNVPPFADPDPALHDEAVTIAQRGLTLAQGGATLPLPPSTRLALIDCLLPKFSAVEEALERAELLRAMLAHAFADVRHLVLSPDLADDEVAQAIGLAQGCDALLLVTRNASLIPRQFEVARLLATVGVPVIHAAARTPYDAGIVSSAVATLLTYSDAEVSLQALVDVLAGRASAGGRSPVTLPFLHGGAEAS